MTIRAARTRAQQVFDRLHVTLGVWVDGPELANEQVGGSEGLRRLREQRVRLREQGFAIEERRHPDRQRASWQYRLVAVEPEAPVETTRHDQPVAFKALCTRPGCAHLLESVRRTEGAKRDGYGYCPRHGAQPVLFPADEG